MTIKPSSMPMSPGKSKVILVAYPAQGHLTPMLNLAITLVSLGFQPVLAIPNFIYSLIFSQINPSDGISCISIPDGLDETSPCDFFAIEMAMENHMPLHLERFVSKLIEEDGDDVIAFMVVDLLASFAINVGYRCGIQVAGFWPVMLAAYELIAAIPYMIGSGLISETGFPLHEDPISIPGQPMINKEELPWLIGSPSERNSRFTFWRRTLDRKKKLEHLLINTFPGECIPMSQALDNDDQLLENGFQDLSPLVLPVGPLNLHVGTTKKASFWEEDLSCLDWLDKQPNGSVLYVSFGSWVSPIGEAKVRSLALALESSGRPFMWVLSHAWREGLPNGYLQRVSKQGKLVSWAPQLQVLQHKSVGCYLTHCGWNSTLEAIQCKKPLLCYPVAGDQFINCAYIVKLWRIGIKLHGFGQRDFEEGLKRVIEDDDISDRIVRLNERIMGKDISSLAMDNMKKFVHDVSKKLSITKTF